MCVGCAQLCGKIESHQQVFKCFFVVFILFVYIWIPEIDSIVKITNYSQEKKCQLCIMVLTVFFLYRHRLIIKDMNLMVLYHFIFVFVFVSTGTKVTKIPIMRLNTNQFTN